MPVGNLFEMKKRAVFLDRDGTINRDVGYPDSYNLIELYPESFEAVRKINQAGLLAVVITNQSGVGRGLIKEENLQEIHERMAREFSYHHSRLDAFYYCPHYIFAADPKYRADCSCRKPLPGLALRAARDLNINTAGSYMVGDKVEDILLSLNIKARPVLVLTGYGQRSLEVIKKEKLGPVHIAQNLLEAILWILEQEKTRGETI